jgi:Lon protease-like protein
MVYSSLTFTPDELLSLYSFCPRYQALVDGMASQLKLQGASVPERASSLARWNPVLLQQRVSDLEAANAG